MKVKLKQLTLINFKGAKKQVIDFTNETSIYGDNGAGKTTIFDSFTWLLFGKDSNDRSDFAVKYTGPNGQTIDKQDVEVFATIAIDGVDLVFKRVLREQWVTKRGSENVEFKGNETLYFIDDLPLKLSEFQTRINDLIDEKLFKLITSPTAFNALPWKDRRSILVSIVGVVDSNEVVSKLDVSDDKKQELLNLLARDSDLDNQKKILTSKIKTQKDELKLIPTRIDEVLRSIPEEIDFKNIRTQIKAKEILVKNIDESIANESKLIDSDVKVLSNLKKELYSIGVEMEKEEINVRTKAKQLTTVDNSVEEGLKLQIERLNARLREDSIRLQDRRKYLIEVREKWQTVNSKPFEMDSDSCACPTCQREFDEVDIASKRMELEESFNLNKVKMLNDIKAEGVRLGNEIQAEEIKLKELAASIDNLNKQIAPVPKLGTVESFETVHTRLLSELKATSELYVKQSNIKADIESKEKTIGQVNPEFSNKRKIHTDEIELLKNQLRLEDQIKESQKRIEQLSNEERTIAQSIASLERTQFLIETLNRSMVDLLETKVNSLFSLVKFKMFEIQINGGENEVCICTVNGVNYSDLNTAMQINAGLEIINVLNQFHNVYGPIFIDRRESVVKLIETNSQIINLIVSEGDKKLRVV